MYDIGTLTSDITIEKQGEYASLTFDTSSNVAYFSNVTVGAIASTMAGYEVEQIINGFASTTVHFSSQGGFGGYIDFNGDGTRMVLGASTSFSSAQGRAYVYHLEDGSWVQKVDIPSPNTSYQRFGDSVLMNEDGTRIAVNQWTYDRIHIYEYTNGAWPTSPTTSITTSNNSGKGDMDWNKDGTVIVAGDGSESSTRKTYVYRLNGGTWTETNIGSVGHGVAINGAGTRVLIGANSVGKIYEANYDSGTSTWSSLTEVHTSSSSWPVRIRMDDDGTTAVAINGTNGQGRILERQSGTSWTSVMDVQGRCSFYGRGSGSISYDGTMVLTGDNYYNPGSVTAQGRAYLYQYSGGSWSLTKTYENPDASPATNDYWGYGTAMAKNTKDRLAIGMTGDDTAGADYGSVHIYTNAIPDFISFDTYNKLSLSGITNPTSKLHALPTGAESTTTYDIGTATNIYIESEGTYTAEMKGSSAFALDSNVVSGTISFPSRTSYRYLALAFPRNNYENSMQNMIIEFDDGTKFDNVNQPANSAFTQNYAPSTGATTDVFSISQHNVWAGSSLGWSAGTWYCPFHIDCGSDFTKKVKRVTIIHRQSDYQYSLIVPRLYGSSSVPSTPGLAANWNYVCHVESIQNGWTSSYDMEPKAYRYIGLAGYRTKFTMHIYEFSIELVDGTVYDGSNIPTVSSNMTISSGSAANTIDGDFTTRANWNSGSTYTSASQQYVYLKVDLGSAKKVKHVRVWSNHVGSYENGTNSMNYYGSSTNTSSVNAEGSSDWNRLGPIEMLKSNDTTEQTINSSLYDSKLEFDGYNKLSLNKFDPTSSTLKYESNTYDLGTISNVYIAYPGTYSAEIKGATNFALSSNITGSLGTYLTLHDNVAISHTTGGGQTLVTVNNIKGNKTYKISFNKQWTDSHASYSTRLKMYIKDSSDGSIRELASIGDYLNRST